ncbi:MAG: hypothetical protein JEZ02_00260 [Desulfatibacillum sp.]|nr:hypothetical protein [Desulfatibacillum sp.]
MKRGRWSLVVLATLFFFAGSVLADMVSDFHLKDGSVIRGTIIAHASRVYSIRSPSLGVIRIHESKISSINTQSSSAGSGQASAAASPGASGISGGMSNSDVARQSQAIGQQMMNNPDIMGAIGSLSADPEFMEILSDPAIMAAVSAGDVNALMANPKFMQLMSNPQVQQITRMATE